MSSQQVETNTRACWFVGAAYGGKNDQTSRFLKDGIWENGYQDKHLDTVRSIQAGDRIAIKAAYTRKHKLPFDNLKQTVSVMGIKAIGKVTKNHGDGRTLSVEWTKCDPVREWYFYTNRSTIWRVLPGEWMTDALISFTFEDKPQDLNRFRNAPYWSVRFGEKVDEKQKFKWTRFYEAMADKLISFRERRDELVKGIHAIAARVKGMSNLQDQYIDGSSGPLKDICPFTAMGIFNRGITNANRKIIATEFAELLGVNEPVPESFEGIPILNNQKSWFFGFEVKREPTDREPTDIDVLWEVFAEAIRYADTNAVESSSAFMMAYNNATRVRGVGWNLTMGLYWIRPWDYPTLEAQSQQYIEKKLSIEIGRNGPKKRCNANDYLRVMDLFEARFKEDAFPVHSFPELSLAAWSFQGPGDETWGNIIYRYICTLCKEKGDAEFSRREFQEKYLDELRSAFPGNNTIEFSIDRQMQVLRDEGKLEFLVRGNYRWVEFDPEGPEEFIVGQAPIEPYSVEDIINDGCFIAQIKIEKMLERLRSKKNLILQGPPGTGKTWLAKRLAFALMGQRNDRKMRPVQFHPNLSYEDFIRGWRPSGEGKLSLVDGPFMEMVKGASENPTVNHVIVIEEINRGNPAQIFGEMLTLLEVDKRTPTEALELCYHRGDDERVYIPDNLYVIGTMNIADRSLALVDFAFRRRFAFIELEPVLGKAWLDWVHERCGIDSDLLSDIAKRISVLNEQIATDSTLGPQFRIGHSYVTPPIKGPVSDAREWFRNIVESEIGPLLDEYWFDSLDKAQKARQQLIEGF